MHSAKWLQQRFVFTAVTFFAVINLYLLRVCLPISLTQMVKPPGLNETEHKDLTCPIPETESGIDGALVDGANLDSERFEWSQDLQGLILSSFYIGYVVMHVPGGMLADRLGGKVVVLIGLVTSSLLSLLTPAAVALWGSNGLIAVRVSIGFSQGGMFPAVTALLAVWVPMRERGRVGSIVFCAGPFGAVIGNYVLGLLLGTFQSWRIGFYVFGVVGLISAVIFATFTYNSPSVHPYISDDEKAYLKREIGSLERDKNIKTVPWTSIITSVPVLALLLAQVVGDWAHYVILINLPRYMNDVLHVSIEDNGFYTSLPWAMFILVIVFCGALSDKLISSGRLTITRSRKMFTVLGAVVGSVSLMVAMYSGCNVALVGFSLAMSVGALGALASCQLINPMDLSPNFAGIIFGILGTFSDMMGVITPIAVSTLAPNSLQSEWRVVFYITVIAHVVQTIGYLAFGSGEVQPWNTPPQGMSTVETQKESQMDGSQIGAKSILQS